MQTAPIPPPADVSRRRSWSVSIIAYIIAPLLAVGGMVATTGFWRNSLRVPFNYSGGDSFYYLVAAKTVQETGWFNVNPLLGAPGTLDMGDFPTSDGLHLAILKLLNAFTGDYAVSINIYWLLTFALAAIFTLAALRQLRIARPVATVAAAIYALAPYHFRQGHGPLFFAGYFFLPLSLLVAIQLAGVGAAKSDRDSGKSDSPARFPRIFFGRSDGERSIWQRVFAGGFFAAAVIVALTASTGVYYAFFSAFFVAIGALLGAAHLRSWRYLLAPAVLIALIVLTVLLNVSHSLIFHAHAGPDPLVATRKPADAETFGLRLSYLLLPIADHRLSVMNDLRDRFNPPLPLEAREVTETALGSAGAIGLIALLALLLLGAAGLRLRAPLGGLVSLNFAGVLLGTTGGLGAIFAFLIFPQIRSYDRMGICLEFFAIAGLALLLDRAIPEKWRQGRGFAALLAMLAAIFIVATLDQTPASTPDFAAQARSFDSDREFVRRIESRVPAGSMIFQLPCVGFPEQPSFGKMLDYDLFRGYLHSQTLRWSYGAMIGRPAFAWQIQTRSLPTPQFVAAIRDAGFAGIYLDRFSAPRDLATIERDLESSAGQGKFASDDGRLVFFPLIP